MKNWTTPNTGAQDSWLPLWKRMRAWWRTGKLGKLRDSEVRLLLAILILEGEWSPGRCFVSDRDLVNHMGDGLGLCRLRDARAQLVRRGFLRVEEESPGRWCYRILAPVLRERQTRGGGTWPTPEVRT